MQVLQNAYSKAAGEYRLIFASRLASRLISLNRLSEAEKFVVDLHREDPANEEVFRQLAELYVKEGKTEELRQSFAETAKAIKEDVKLEPKEIGWKIDALRRQVISAFTRLKDYRAAIEQYIEIINREPEDKLNIESAISYAKRYSETDFILRYYQKTAAESFKNYRWDLILQDSRKQNDAENAVKIIIWRLCPDILSRIWNWFV